MRHDSDRRHMAAPRRYARPSGHGTGRPKKGTTTQALRAGVTDTRGPPAPAWRPEDQRQD